MISTSGSVRDWVAESTPSTILHLLEQRITFASKWLHHVLKSEASTIPQGSHTDLCGDEELRALVSTKYPDLCATINELQMRYSFPAEAA